MLSSISIRTQTIWIAIVISLILHIVLLLNTNPEHINNVAAENVPELEISLNKFTVPPPQESKPQNVAPKEAPPPVPVTPPAPVAAQSPISKKAVQSKIVKPKLAPPLKTSQIQTAKKSISNTILPNASKKHSPTSVDNAASRQQEIQKLKADYLAELAKWLNQHKKYPPVARRRGQEGEISVRFSINTEGKLLSHEIVSPAKHASLNAAVIKMLKSASPMPAIPVELRNGKTKFEYTIPVLFKLTGNS